MSCPYRYYRGQGIPCPYKSRDRDVAPTKGRTQFAPTRRETSFATPKKRERRPCLYIFYHNKYFLADFASFACFARNSGFREKIKRKNRHSYPRRGIHKAHPAFPEKILLQVFSGLIQDQILRCGMLLIL